ncbi:MAG: hypothetical protein OEX13_11235, partial [Gammaproteobacteria bacterium]|nr:hypothetical protein [Gammaproteobacteria bacterium]
AVMRDSQNFVHASEEGVGIVDMPGYKVQKDLDELQKVIDWLDSWPNRRRDLHDTGVSNKPAGNVTVLHNPLINSG